MTKKLKKYKKDTINGYVYVEKSSMAYNIGQNFLIARGNENVKGCDLPEPFLDLYFVYVVEAFITLH